MTRLSRRGFLAASAGIALGVRSETPEQRLNRVVDGMSITAVQWEKEVLPVFDMQAMPLPLMYRVEFAEYRQSLIKRLGLNLGVPSRIFLGGHR